MLKVSILAIVMALPACAHAQVTYQRYGDKVFGSDGSTIEHYGNKDYYTPPPGATDSDGSPQPPVTCEEFGDQTFCDK